MDDKRDFSQDAHDRWRGILNEVHPGWTLYNVTACVDSMGACLIEMVCHTPEGKERYFIPFYDQEGTDREMVENDEDAYLMTIGGATDAQSFDWTPAYTAWQS